MPRRAVIYLILGSFFFSGSTLFVKLCHLTAADKTFFRMLIPCALGLIGIFSYKLDLNLKSKRLWLGSALNVIRLYMFVYALDFTSASIATVLAYTSPAFTAINSALILKEKLSRNVLIGICLGFIGVIFSCIDNNYSFEFTSGVFIILLSSLIFSLNNILIKKDLVDLSPVHILFWQNLVGTIILSTQIPTMNGTYLDFIYALLFGISAGFLGFYFFYRALKIVPLNVASAFTYTELIFVFIWSSIFLGEEIGLRLIIATVLILFGNYLVLKSKSDHGAPRESA